MTPGMTVIHIPSPALHTALTAGLPRMQWEKELSGRGERNLAPAAECMRRVCLPPPVAANLFTQTAAEYV